MVSVRVATFSGKDYNRFLYSRLISSATHSSGTASGRPTHSRTMGVGLYRFNNLHNAAEGPGPADTWERSYLYNAEFF